MKLVQIIDDHHYLQTNCWQHQLFEHVHNQCDEHVILTRADIERGVKVPDSDVLLSTLKLRTIFKINHTLASTIGQRHVHVYEQDPWCAFVDGAPYFGAYEALTSNLNVTFINTSQWWSDYVNSLGMHSIFTRMWVKPEYCSEGIPWSSRPIRVGFKGKVHPHRQKAIQELEALGVEVTVLPSGDYSSYLQDLSQMQFFFHEESGEKWTIDGRNLGVKNCSWAKDIEIVSRGCFSLRLYEPEAEAYFASRIPAFKMFRDLKEVPRLIEDALRDGSKSDQCSRASVDFIRQTSGWFRLSDLYSNTIHQCLKRS